jgi:hypothetical protein
MIGYSLPNGSVGEVTGVWVQVPMGSDVQDLLIRG